MYPKKVCIGRLRWGCTKHALWERICNEGCAGVLDVHMVRQGGYIPGKRIVAFVDCDTAENAFRLVNLHGSLWPEVAEVPVTIQFAQMKGEQSPWSTPMAPLVPLLITQLDPSITPRPRIEECADFQ